MRHLLISLWKNPWRKVLFAAAAVLSCSFPTVLTLEHDCRESLPKPRLVASHSQLLAKETLNLTCLPQGNFTSIQWLMDGRSLQPSNQLHLSEGNQTLVRTGVTRDDAGAYQCEVRNSANCSRSNATNISVAYGPDAVEIKPSGNVTQLFGSPLDLICSADSVPAAQYSWSFNNTSVDQNGSLLAINSTTWEQEGIYECSAYNAVTNLTGSASVMIFVVTTSGQDSPFDNPKSIPRIISGIVVGILAGVVLMVIPVYCFCARVRSKKPPQVKPTMSRCDNRHPPSMQAKPQPKLENPADPSSTYQELQGGDEALYQELDRYDPFPF